MRRYQSRFLTKFINEIREISGHANEPRTLRVADFLLLSFILFSFPLYFIFMADSFSVLFSQCQEYPWGVRLMSFGNFT